MKCFSYIGGCGIFILRHVKEELIWAIDTIDILMLLVIIIMLFEKLNTTEKVKNIDYNCIVCISMWSLVI